MLTAIMKWVSIAILLLGFFENLPVGSQEWSVRNGGYLELFNMLVCLSALLVVAEGFRGRKYFWASGFVAIAVLFNPIPRGTFPEDVSRVGFCLHPDVSGFTGSFQRATPTHRTLDKRRQATKRVTLTIPIDSDAESPFQHCHP